MADPIREALERLIHRMMNELPTIATTDAWAAEARAILSALTAEAPSAGVDSSIYSWGVHDRDGFWVAEGTANSFDEAKRAGRAAMAVAPPNFNPCKLRVFVRSLLLEVSSDD